MKAVSVLFVVSLSFGLIYGDDKPAKAKDTPLENVICKKCNCDAEKKIIECSNLSLTKMFTVDEWAALNATKDNYEVLKLDHNLLTEIDVAFPPLRFPLKVIDFRHNKINKLVKNLFTNLDYIEEIDFSYNELTAKVLKQEVFEGKYNSLLFEPLLALKRLRLSYNLLNNLDTQIFDHTTHLQELYIDNNPFQIIHPDVVSAFVDIPQLQKLDMSMMELKSLPEPLFHPLGALRWLNLEGNLFKTIPDALLHARNVRELSLSENPLLDLSEDNPMIAMPRLEKLNMTHLPVMKSIGNASMAGLESLIELRMSNNRHLSYIDPAAFEFTDKDHNKRWPLIQRLFLDNNNLSSLSSETFITWSKMEEIHIHDNPWLCDCQIQWFNDLLMPIIEKKTPHFIEKIVCDAPHPMSGKKLEELADQHFDMRCLDKYGAHPERDSALLVALLIGVLLGMPLAFASIMIYKRGCGNRGGPADYSRAFYKRAEMQDDNI